MKKAILSLATGALILSACQKEVVAPPPPVVIAEACLPQTGNPDGRSYPVDSVTPYSCTGKFCGLMPLSSRNYWVYQDSIFADGAFIKVRYDTLRFAHTYRSAGDGLVWWEPTLSVGLPEKLYTNDSSFFKLEERLFVGGILDAKKDYSLFPGDSIRYLASFEDAAALGRSLKINSPISSPAGSFDQCIYFEKNARNYRRDQVYFKPGLGVIKYILEKAPMGTREIKLQQVSTLIKYHLE